MSHSQYQARIVRERKDADAKPFWAALRAWLYHVTMTGMYRKRRDSDLPDRSVNADALLRQEPDEDEDEEDDHKEEEEEDDDEGEGYSE